MAKTKVVKKTKKKVWEMPDKYYVEEVKNLFDLFVDELNGNVPKNVLKELKDLMEEYATDAGVLPIDAIKMAIDEWINSGRI